MTTQRALIEKAVKAVGSQQKLAEAIGKSQQTVSVFKRGGRISGEDAIAIERATHGKVKRGQLCPHIFGKSAA